MDSEESDDYNSEEDKKRGAKTKKMRYRNKYSAAYENDPVFKDWIKASTKGDLYASLVINI